MTKNEFIKFYDIFTQVVKQEVNEEYCMNASAGLIDGCGGYTLELRPDCLMWGDEFAMINSLCDCFCVAFEIHLNRGLLIIR